MIFYAVSLGKLRLGKKIPPITAFSVKKQRQEGRIIGAGEVRTRDPQTASLVLSQLSYSPDVLRSIKILRALILGQCSTTISIKYLFLAKGSAAIVFPVPSSVSSPTRPSGSRCG